MWLLTLIIFESTGLGLPLLAIMAVVGLLLFGVFAALAGHTPSKRGSPAPPHVIGSLARRSTRMVLPANMWPF